MRCFVFDRHTANGYICHKNDKPMSGIKDTATVTLNVNGAQAKQMMGELETKIKATRSAIEQMKASAADPKDIEKARKQLKNYEKQLGDMQSAVQGVNTALTSLDTASTAQISRAIKTLQKQLKDLPAGAPIDYSILTPRCSNEPVVIESCTIDESNAVESRRRGLIMLDYYEETASAIRKRKEQHYGRADKPE